MTTKAQQAEDAIVLRILAKDKRGALLQAEQDLNDILKRFDMTGVDREGFDLCVSNLMSQVYDRALESVNDIAELRGY